MKAMLALYYMIVTNCGPLFCSGLFGLFVSEGLLGWWMVKSGFEEREEEIKTPR